METFKYPPDYLMEVATKAGYFEAFQYGLARITLETLGRYRKFFAADGLGKSHRICDLVGVV